MKKRIINLETATIQYIDLITSPVMILDKYKVSQSKIIYNLDKPLFRQILNDLLDINKKDGIWFEDESTGDIYEIE